MYGTAAALSVFVPGGAAIAKGGELMVDALEAEEAAQGTLSSYMSIVPHLDVSTAENGAVFYSGPGNRALAEE